MVCFLYKGSNGLEWVNSTAKIHKYPDISGHKIPENGNIAAFSGALLKYLDNLLSFSIFRSEKAIKLLSFWLSTFIKI